MNNIDETTASMYRLMESMKEMNEFIKNDFTNNFVNSFKAIEKHATDLNSIFKDNQLAKSLSKEFGASPLVALESDFDNITSTLNTVKDVTALASTAMSGLGLAVSVVTTAFDLLKGAVNLFFKEYFDSCKNITNGMSDFYSSIDSAGSIFDGFNQLIIDTSDSTEEWKQNLDGVQKTLSELSKKGSNMSADDIASFKDNYNMMKDYYEKELELIEESGSAIQKRAEIAVMTGDLTAEQMQRLVNDAEEHKDTLIAKVSEQYEEEVLLLAQKYTTENGLITEEGKKQIEELTKARDEQIQLAHDKCGKTLEILTNGYYDQMNLQKMSVEEQDQLNDELKLLENNFLNEWLFIIASGNLKESELEEKRLELQKKYDDEEQMIRKKYYENMSDFSDEELSVLVSMCAMTETYGGKMNELTSDYVMNLIDN